MDSHKARALMHEWVESDALRHHMECVASCMDAAAQHVDPGARDRWVTCGLLHDFDYEKHPSPDEHPMVGVDYLRAEHAVDEEILQAILGHATYSGVPRTTPMARTLFAVDELAGFIVACCRVRPDGIGDLTPKSVKKKLKTSNFAAAVNREDIALGVEELGVDLTEHIQFCIDALRTERDRLDL